MSVLPEMNQGLKSIAPTLGQLVEQAVVASVQPLLEGQGDALGAALDEAVVAGVEHAMTTMAQRYAAQILGAEKSSRVGSRVGYRSGTRTISIGSPFGVLRVEMVKSRTGALRPPFLSGCARFTESMKDLGRRLWTAGLSYRGISDVAEDTLGVGASHTSVGHWVQEAQQEVLTWLNRPISASIRYLVLDGLYVSVKRQTAKDEALLVAVGVTADGHREILDVLPAPSESTDSWRTLLARLRGRGLCCEQLQLVISDGCAGLISAIGEEFPGVRRQRCVVHKIRNVIGTSPPALKAVAPKEASAIWKAPNKSEARVRQAAFIAQYQDSHPKLAAIVADDFEATLSFYDQDASRWASLKTTNLSERVNRELRRKFRDMGACKGDVPVSRTAALVAMKLSKQWEGSVVEGFKIKKTRRAAHS
jgi:putative transposase